MKRTLTTLLVCVACLVPSFQASADVTVGVDPSQTWLGYMNVSELPENGGAYVFGSGWGFADLTAVFSGPTLTLGPNSVNDVNNFWYQNTSGTAPDPVNPGGPGQAGNKILEANAYVEATDVYAGQTLTFDFTVLSNTFTSAHSTIAFIKDFAPDYSSFNIITSDPLSPGSFSISLPTDPGLGRHVQYGFATTGVNVWITDVAPFGTLTIEAESAGTPGDFNADGTVDGRDFLAWQRGESPTALSAGDLSTWQGAYGSPLIAISAVPEPTSIALLVAMSGLLAVRRGRHSA